ncbi:MAG TPA: protein-glutamate O-methyltransferase CheR, partial [Chthonomonadales bacterium]|nr:protein-glutamate O-methyltransferase CheR [Chthonomonadales bacterium]
MEPERTTQAESGAADRELELESLELELLIEGIFVRYGYDFREYSRPSLKRRVRNVMQAENLTTISALQERILRSPALMARFLPAISVNLTALFRDPAFFAVFREHVAPVLRTYPFIRIWHAGCSTGEEVYSMAIMLQEERLYDRCLIYATDLDDAALRRSREGIFPLEAADEYAANYLAAGGKKLLSDYYTAAYGSAIFHSSLKENIVFSQHNLAQDSSFNEFQVILCRNVMIYFRKKLQHRVHHLIYESLALYGVLGLGSKENL